MKRVPQPKHFLIFNRNAVIRFLTFSDIVWSGAAGLLGPIFAIFIIDFIDGGNAAVAGAAAAIYLVTKSLLQIPIATILDKIRGEKDDFWVMFIASGIGALTPLLYLLVSTPGQLYAVQFFYGAIIALTFPSWMAIFTRHIDSQKEATEWGVYYTLTDLSQAVTASLGGLLAVTIGFYPLIILVSAIGVLGVLLMYPIKPYIKNK